MIAIRPEGFPLGKGFTVVFTIWKSYQQSCQQIVDNIIWGVVKPVEFHKGALVLSISKVIHRFNEKLVQKNCQTILYTRYSKSSLKKSKCSFFAEKFSEFSCGNVDKSAWQAGFRKNFSLTSLAFFTIIGAVLIKRVSRTRKLKEVQQP